MIDLFGCLPGATNGVGDVAGLSVGHAICADGEGDSGVSVIVAPKGATASVDVRGGGPGTRETDLLAPHNTVQQVHAITLSGGSAFGLDAATGVMAELESRGIGFPVLGAEQPAKVVPIVPAAVIFDLLLGRWDSRPDAATGRMAVKNALDEHSVAVGNIGAGLGASAGALKGGFGQASAVFPDDGPLAGTTVAAAVVVNPQGAVFNPVDGKLWGIAAELGGEFAPYGVRPDTPVAEAAIERLRSMNLLGTKMLNTTIGAVATDADFSKAQVKRMALSAHDGLARAIRPAHMPMDGDTLFGLATGTKPLPAGIEPAVAMTMVSAAAANCVERAIVHAVLAATTAFDVPSWKEVTEL
ncbi:P1 family peptidase [Corynebacterium resistens]|uniref:P1 family peptidase n=1 Tax=Corynebacterium resistens TaxID=258224 RepID=UPI0001E28F9E|nr:P1 family peptidase [Corynebacterium resistens]